MSPTVLKHPQLAANLQHCELHSQEVHIANEKRLQLEAQDMEHRALSMAHQREETIQGLRHHTDKQPDHLKTQWKRQVSQAATYKAKIHTQYKVPQHDGEI